MIPSNPTFFHLYSPFFHPLRVKEVRHGKGLYIRRNNNSLYIFLTFTPTPPRDARTRVFACVREGGVKEVKEVTALPIKPEIWPCGHVPFMPSTPHVRPCYVPGCEWHHQTTPRTNATRANVGQTQSSPHGASLAVGNSASEGGSMQ